MKRSQSRRFAHRLALALGIPRVRAMLRRMTAQDFHDWEIYAELEPFGELRADYRAAQVAQMIFNMAVESRHRKPMKDFVLPAGEREEEVQKPQDPVSYTHLRAHETPEHLV